MAMRGGRRSGPPRVITRRHPKFAANSFSREVANLEIVVASRTLTAGSQYLRARPASFTSRAVA
eukprot:278180-Prymnesium_polylepis.1